MPMSPRTVTLWLGVRPQPLGDGSIVRRALLPSKPAAFLTTSISPYPPSPTLPSFPFSQPPPSPPSPPSPSLLIPPHLSSSADHGGPADVDVLNALL
ncbi:unnamed protein product [Closterium sp. NIES-53]